MPILRNQRAEKFCQIIAHEDCEPSEAAFKAGYGVDSHPKRDSYHYLQASRLMSKKEVVLRIQEIRDGICEEEQDKRENMIETLYRAALYDPTKYFKVYQTALENGRVVQDTVLKKDYMDFTKWDAKDRQMIDHFDPKTGNPVFISKTWAIEKLLKILQLDGNSNSVDIEDMLSLFSSAGLRLGRKEELEALDKLRDEVIDDVDDDI